MSKSKPGSSEALERGCTCPVLDNAHGGGSYRGGFIISNDCPLHGKNKKQEARLPTCNEHNMVGCEPCGEKARKALKNPPKGLDTITDKIKEL